MVNIKRKHYRFWSVLYPAANRLYWFRFAYKNPTRLQDGREPLYEVSVSTAWTPREIWVGLRVDDSQYKKWIVFIALIPCLPLRIHLKKIYGAGGPS